MLRCAIILAASFVAVLALRIVGPSDLYDQDQPKTVAYTVDAVRHGRWALPRDMLGRPATKPPMFNWIGAPLVMMGMHEEWALKFPSMIAGLVTAAVTVGLGRGMGAKPQAAKPQVNEGGADAQSPAKDLGWEIGLVAGMLWLASYPAVKLVYTARPDMVLTAFLVAAFALAVGLQGGSFKNRNVAALALWLCVAGAGLTKGLPALLPPIFIVASAWLIHRRWRALWDTGIAWGVPLTLLIIGVWVWFAYGHDPVHFHEKFMWAEAAGRVSRGGPMRLLLESWKMPAWFVARFAPWSILAIVGALLAVGHPRLGPVLAPAALWVVLVIVFFSLSGGKRADYLAPAYPAAAVLAAWWLVDWLAMRGQPVWHAAVAGAVIAVAVAGFDFFYSPAARTGLGDNVIEFAHQVRSQVGDQALRDELILFENAGYTPLQSLLGMNQASVTGDPAAMRSADWIIRPWVDGELAELVSKPIAEVNKKKPGRLGLFRVGR